MRRLRDPAGLPDVRMTNCMLRPNARPRAARLREREVDGGRGRLAGAQRSNVADDADDLYRLPRTSVETNGSADRIVVGPVETCGRLVDDRHERPLGDVTLVEESAPLQRNAKRLERPGHDGDVARAPTWLSPCDGAGRPSM